MPADEPVTFYQRAAIHPDRVAVVEPDGVSVSNGQLLAAVNQTSNALRAAGCEHGARVAWVGGSSSRFLELYLACMQIGVHFVPVNLHLAVDEVRHIVADSGVRLLLADDSLLPMATAAADAAGLPAAARIARPAGEGWVPWSAFLDGAATSAPEHRSYGQPMLYTAGTTGRPRGVKWSAIPAAIDPEMAQAAAQERFGRHGMTVGGVTLVASPLCHGAPLSLATQALHHGHTLMLAGRWDAERWLQMVSEHRVTHAHLLPVMFYRLDHVPAEVRRRFDLSSLRSVTHGGEPCSVPLKRRMIEWLGPVLHEFYSASEGVGTSISSEQWLDHPGSVGRTGSDGAEIRIRDEDGGEVPAGEVGQIWIGHSRRVGPSISDVHFTTYGDLGYIDADGWVFVVDRRTDLIVSGGVNIYPSEVERRLAEHPDVAEVAVVGVPDPEWGQRVVAVVVPRQGGGPTAGELTDWCRAGLARFKCPREFEFRDELPHSAAGKLLRRDLRDELRSRLTGEDVSFPRRSRRR